MKAYYYAHGDVFFHSSLYVQYALGVQIPNLSMLL